MGNVKRLIQRLFRSIGYEIRRVSPDCSFHADPFETQQRLLDDQKVRNIFDVGANIGLTTKKYARLFPQATVYCFEPSEMLFKQLDETYRDSTSVKLFQLAVTDFKGTQQLFLHSASVMNSLLQLADDAQKYLNPELLIGDSICAEVETTTLDNFCVKNSINKIQILKIDIQGNELKAFRGASNLLQTAAIDIIFTEVLFAKLYEGQSYFYEISEFLLNYGYKLYALYNMRLAKNGILGWADALFVSSEIEKKITQAKIDI